MKRLILTLNLLLTVVFLQGQQNLLFEQTFVHASDVAAYDAYLKDNFSKIARGRLDAGAIVGWDVWKAVPNQKNDFTHMITTITDITDEKKYDLNYPELMGMSEKRAEIMSENVRHIRTIKRRQYWNVLANVDENGPKETGIAPQFMVINFMKVHHMKNYAKYEAIEKANTPKIEKGDARVGWTLHRRLDNLGTDVYYTHTTIDWFANWKDFIKSNMGTQFGPKVWPKAWTEMDKVRDLRKRVMLWKFMEVK